jgi:DNA-directed RNA polymerase specialized sigma subunit
MTYINEIPLEDRIKAGRKGLRIALATYDPQKGIPFSMYCVQHIRKRLKYVDENFWGQTREQSHNL